MKLIFLSFFLLPFVSEAANPSCASAILPAPKHIGIFVGSFDPPHSMHKQIVERSQADHYLDRVYVIADSQVQYKPEISPLEQREKMLEILFRQNAGVTTSLSEEMRAGLGPGELWDIHRVIGQAHPHDHLHLIVGADTLEWYASVLQSRPLPRANFIVVLRNQSLRQPRSLNAGSVRTSIQPMQAISSSAIRQQLREAETPSEVDPEVLGYIREQGLYQAPVVQ